MPEDTYIPQGVNPHQAKEWQMMRARKKPMALFALHLETLPAEFLGAHDFFELTVTLPPQSRNHSRNRRRPEKMPIFKIFSQPDTQHDAKKLSDALKSCHAPHGKITPAAEREIGQLLGYDKKDIETYLNWVEQFKNSLYL